MVNVEELLASIKEYSNEDINDPQEVKAQISKILKTHRPIKLADYQYGFSSKGKEGYRLIIKEENDKAKVREFTKRKNNWNCTYNCRAVSLKMNHGILFASIQHNDKCDTKDLVFVMKVQSLLKEGKFSEAHGLIVNVKKHTHDTSNQSLSSSMLDESALSVTDMEHESILDHSFAADDTNDSHDSNITPSELQITTPTLVEIVPESLRSSIKRESDDTEYCIEIVQPVAKKPKIESNNVQHFSFEYPSSDTLKEICKKVNIEYDRSSAYKFWSDIAIREIVPVFENIKNHSFKSSNIFACLSQFFTGKTDDCFDFHKAVYKAFRIDLINSATKSSSEIEEMCTSNNVTDEHLQFMTKFLSCRIGIYENGSLKQFGKWETENYEALTLILSFKNGFYSVVLDL